MKWFAGFAAMVLSSGIGFTDEAKAAAVVVNGQAYYFSFEPPSCSATFDSCAFDFTNGVDAGSAAAQLAALGLPCGGTKGCVFGIPYGLFPDAPFFMASTVNVTVVQANPGDPPSLLTSTGSAPIPIPGGVPGQPPGIQFAWVKFSAVPEPSTWAMMVVGFGLIGFSLRRSKKTRRVAAFA